MLRGVVVEVGGVAGLQTGVDTLLQGLPKPSWFCQEDQEVLLLFLAKRNAGFLCGSEVDEA